MTADAVTPEPPPTDTEFADLLSEYGGAQFAAGEWGTRGSTIKDWSRAVDEARDKVEAFFASQLARIRQLAQFATDIYKQSEEKLAAANERIRQLEADARRLDWLEANAGRRLWIRDEPDETICNIYVRGTPSNPLGGGVFASLRDAADRGLRETDDTLTATSVAPQKTQEPTE